MIMSESSSENGDNLPYESTAEAASLEIQPEPPQMFQDNSPNPGSYPPLYSSANGLSDFSEIDLNDHPSLTDAIRLFVLRSNMSQRNSKFFIRLLNTVRNLAVNDNSLSIPNLNAIISPANQVLLKNVPVCPKDTCLVVDSKCTSCNQVITKPNFLSIGNLDLQLTMLIRDENFMNLVKKTKRQISEGSAGDIFQGNTYQELLQNMSERDFTFTLNSDGFVISNSSKHEPWPMYLVVNEFIHENFGTKFLAQYILA